MRYLSLIVLLYFQFQQVLKGNVTTSRGILNRCEDVDPKRFVSKLMISMWGREYLASHSITGHSKSVGGVEKEILDQEVFSAIEGEYFLFFFINM